MPIAVIVAWVAVAWANVRFAPTSATTTRKHAHLGDFVKIVNATCSITPLVDWAYKD
jgi:hypothetical protein